MMAATCRGSSGSEWWVRWGQAGAGERGRARRRRRRARGAAHAGARGAARLKAGVRQARCLQQVLQHDGRHLRAAAGPAARRDWAATAATAAAAALRRLPGGCCRMRPRAAPPPRLWRAEEHDALLVARGAGERPRRAGQAREEELQVGGARPGQQRRRARQAPRRAEARAGAHGKLALLAGLEAVRVRAAGRTKSHGTRRSKPAVLSLLPKRRLERGRGQSRKVGYKSMCGVARAERGEPSAGCVRQRGQDLAGAAARGRRRPALLRCAAHGGALQRQPAAAARGARPA